MSPRKTTQREEIRGPADERGGAPATVKSTTGRGGESRFLKLVNRDRPGPLESSAEVTSVRRARSGGGAAWLQWGAFVGADLNEDAFGGRRPR